MGKDKFNGDEKRDMFFFYYYEEIENNPCVSIRYYLSVPEIRLESNMFERGGGGRFYKESQSLS